VKVKLRVALSPEKVHVALGLTADGPLTEITAVGVTLVLKVAGKVETSTLKEEIPVAAYLEKTAYNS